MDENITGEESTQQPEAPQEEAKPKKNLPLIAGAFVVLFILAGAGNFVHLKMTYVPPEPAPMEELVEEEGPILTIDLSEDEPLWADVELGEADYDSLGQMIADSITQEDSIQAVIEGLHANLQAEDSLLTATREELEWVKKSLKIQDAQDDSVNQKRSLKLAKIVENMPPEEAAKMLEPLNDVMVIDILMRLKQRQAARIMAEFSSSRSARLSEEILKPLVKG